LKQVSADGPREVVADKGYHSRAVVSELTEWACVRTARSRIGDRSGGKGNSGNNRRRMQIGGALAESEASGCYGSAVKCWSDGINICMIGVGCVACICEVGKTFSSGWWCTWALQIWGC
jgi:hypothetical protein